MLTAVKTPGKTYKQIFDICYKILNELDAHFLYNAQ